MSDQKDRAVPAHVAADEATVGGRANLGRDVGAAEEQSAIATAGEGRHESGVVRLPAFDAHHPPAQALIDDCVHCGFCLPTCPTYLLFGEEMDSPRGRIYLMREGLEGEAMTDSMVRHFDLCLGCLACVTACPSGVQYEKLIEATRQQVERRYERTKTDRLFREILFKFLPYPRRLAVMAAALRPYHALRGPAFLRRSGAVKLFSDRLKALIELAPRPAKRADAARIPEITQAAGVRRRVVGMLAGCVQSVFFPKVNAATVRVLAAEGCEVISPRGQGCCGALSLHAGREEEAMAFARKTIDVFEAAGVDNIAVNVAGCGSAMKEYGHLLRDDPEYAERAAHFSARVRDVSELIHEMGPVANRHPLPVVAAYHDACHLAHGQGIRKQPRELLLGIPGVELRTIAEGEICCGSAGIYNLLEPEPAALLGERKARNVQKTGATILVSANPGCTMQIRTSLERLGASLPIVHPVEMLDASIRAGALESLRD